MQFILPCVGMPCVRAKSVRLHAAQLDSEQLDRGRRCKHMQSVTVDQQDKLAGPGGPTFGRGH